MPKDCSIDGCVKTATARGWCPMHYMRWRKYGDPLTNLRSRGACSVPGCDRPHSAKGYCKLHHQRMLRSADIAAPVRPSPGTQTGCSVAGCERPHKARGFCAKHYTDSWWGRQPGGNAYLARRAHHLLVTYGLTVDQYSALAEAQDGCCALCHTDPASRTRGDRWLHVDHDHATGENRGLLCAGCNLTLGCVEALGLDAFAAYLHRY